MQVLLATTNIGKLRELKRILGGAGLDVVGLNQLQSGQLSETADIETGSTFAENALLKARYYHNRTGLVTIGDDSGLEVDALGGGPGIYSARYAGPDGFGPRPRREAARGTQWGRGRRSRRALCLRRSDCVGRGRARLHRRSSGPTARSSARRRAGSATTRSFTTSRWARLSPS